MKITNFSEILNALNKIKKNNKILMSSGKLKLRRFDIKSIKPDKVVVFIGKRETGKSFLVKDLLYYHKDVPIGTVISGTEAANTFYGHMVPSLFIHDAFTPQVFATLLKDSEW